MRDLRSRPRRVDEPLSGRNGRKNSTWMAGDAKRPKTLFSKLAALLITVGVAVPQVTQADDPWEIGAGAVYLNRDASYSGAVVVDNGHNPIMGVLGYRLGHAKRRKHKW